VRVCIIGKFPPIQGGVSARTYWSAHHLARSGHEVHVVTNAKECLPPYRIYMRQEDWRRCKASYGPGSVTTYWTDPLDNSQSFIPMANPFVSKLAAIAVRLHAEHRFDVIYSHYLEPYGVAGYIAAQMTGLPHVVRMAGSDAGRLWRHPQFEALYDGILRSAQIVIAAGTVAKRAVQRGVDSGRIAAIGGFVSPQDVFTPVGQVLDLGELQAEIERDSNFRDQLWGSFAIDRPYFGVCGKLGEDKGSFSLLAAVRQLKTAGLDVGVVAMAHGNAAVESRFRTLARDLGLADRVLQIPFLPPWRVPEFLRGCLAVCCLEQNFPIVFHQPAIPREALLCGACLVGSTEVIRKLPDYERLPSGFGCIAVEDASNVDTLSAVLAKIVSDPAPAADVGTRGCSFARELQKNAPLPQMLECILEIAAARRSLPPAMRAQFADAAIETNGDRFPLTKRAEAALSEHVQKSAPGALAYRTRRPTDRERINETLIAIENAIANGKIGLQSFAPALWVEMALATAEEEADGAYVPQGAADPLFRLSLSRWAIPEGALAGMVPIRNPRLRVLKFSFDVSVFLREYVTAEIPASPAKHPSYVVVFGRSEGTRHEPVLIDDLTARILELSDGTRTAREIIAELDRASNPASSDVITWI
jgi:glycosyltransferase involved in cell wall biosynthesis